ncbi:MAG TPA: HD domain-containing phosphohydrolase [Myxococcota bacterium]|nr:HD domain-containing phosphohydrolase [Myxococcota bacterium]
MSGTVAKLAALNQAARAMNSILEPDKLLDRILSLVEEVFALDNCAVLLFDPVEEAMVIRAARGYRPEVVTSFRGGEGRGVTGHVFSTGEPLIVNDVKGWNGYVEGVAGAHSEMAAPLRIENNVIGVLDAESRRPDAFEEGDLDLFRIFANQAATAINNANLMSRLTDYSRRIERANADLEKRVKELTAVQEASRAIASSLDLHDTLRAIVSTTRDIVRSSSCAIRLLNDEHEEMRELDTTGGASGAAATADAPQRPSTMRSFLGLPLRIGSQVIGYFELGSVEAEAFCENDRRILGVLASQAAIAIENARLFEKTQQTYYETIRSLAQALEARDAYTRGHSERVTRYAVAVAEQMGMTPKCVKVIRYAGLLHDIGKIGISDSILHKRLALSEEEWSVIRSHPLFGDSILQPLKFLEEAQQIVLHHHERLDGSGYPGQLKGEEIPIEARIIAVADAYDAMTSNRPYRQALPHTEALSEIGKASGLQFDSQVVDAFLSVIDEVREVAP